jgi:hypothetical protein
MNSFIKINKFMNQCVYKQSNPRGAVDVGSDGVGQPETARGGQCLRSGDDHLVLVVGHLEALARLLPLVPGVGVPVERFRAAAAGGGGARLAALQIAQARRQVIDHLGARDVALHDQQLLCLQHREEEHGRGRGRLHGCRFFLPLVNDRDWVVRIGFKAVPFLHRITEEREVVFKIRAGMGRVNPCRCTEFLAFSFTNKKD